MTNLSQVRERLKGELKSFYVFLGDRPLTSPLINLIVDRVLTNEEKGLSLDTFEGDFRIEELLTSLKTMPFGANKKVILLKDPFFLWDDNEKKGEQKQEIDIEKFNKIIISIKKNKRVILIIQAENPDNRKKIVKELLLLAEVIDLRIKKDDKKDKKNFLISFCNDILNKNQKKIKPESLHFFIDQVGGDDLVMIQNELEKLINFTSKEEITKDDILLLTIKNKEEQVYELTQQISEKNLKKSLMILKNLMDKDIQPIVIAGVLFNFIKRLLVIKEILSQQEINTENYDLFKKEHFPRIKSIFEKYNLNLFSNIHPYALFITIKHSHNFSQKKLLEEYKNLYSLDLLLKGSTINPNIILEHLIIKIIS